MLEVDFDRLRTERANQTVPSNMKDFEASVGTLKECFSPWLTEHLKQIGDDPKTREILAAIQAPNTSTLSKPQRCSIYIDKYEGLELYGQSQIDLEAENTGNFVVFYDLANVVEDAALSIARAEGVFARGAELEALQAFGSYISKPDVAPEIAEQTLKRGAVRFQMYADLMQKNQSGLHVMHYQVISTLNNLFGFPTNTAGSPLKGYALAVNMLGELYAAELYRVIYPLC